jgi:hypothetical protein
VAMASALIRFYELRKTVQIGYPKHMKKHEKNIRLMNIWPRLVDWNDWRIFNLTHSLQGLQPTLVHWTSLNCRL